MLLFALESSRPFGQSVAQHLNIALSDHEERDFEDGEHKIRPLTCVREEDVFVIQSLHSDDDQSVNEKLCRLLFYLGAVRDAGARRVTAVLPYLCYARKDRKTKTRDPVTTRYLAQLFESVGVDRVATIDVHNLAAFQNSFRIPTVHLEAASLFVNHLVEQSAGHDLVVVSPDAGGVKRADRLRQLLNDRVQSDVTLAMMEKHRSSGVVRGEMFAGDVNGRVAIIVDDLISSGTTLARTAAACQKRGAAKVQAVAAHALLVGNAGEVLISDALQQVIITNTVPPFRLRGHDAMKKLVVLDAAPLVARTIKRLHDGEPVEGELLS